MTIEIEIDVDYRNPAISETYGTASRKLITKIIQTINTILLTRPSYNMITVSLPVFNIIEDSAQYHAGTNSLALVNGISVGAFNGFPLYVDLLQEYNTIKFSKSKAEIRTDIINNILHDEEIERVITILIKNCDVILT